MNICHLFSQTFPNKMNFESFNKFDKNFTLIKTIHESSHKVYSLIKCKECDALFLFDFYEYVNFGGGDDEIYIKFIQVNDEDQAKKLIDEGNCYDRNLPSFIYDADNSFKIVKGKNNV